MRKAEMRSISEISIPPIDSLVKLQDDRDMNASNAWAGHTRIPKVFAAMINSPKEEKVKSSNNHRNKSLCLPDKANVNDFTLTNDIVLQNILVYDDRSIKEVRLENSWNWMIFRISRMCSISKELS